MHCPFSIFSSAIGSKYDTIPLLKLPEETYGVFPSEYDLIVRAAGDLIVKSLDISNSLLNCNPRFHTRYLG